MITRFELVAPISSRTAQTVLYWLSAFGSDESITRSCKSAFFAAESVDLKASIRLCGRLLINPTVSVRRMPFPSFSLSFRVSGSSVAKSLSSTNASAPVSAFRRLDFPAFV